jgi:hypothetical protein
VTPIRQFFKVQLPLLDPKKDRDLGELVRPCRKFRFSVLSRRISVRAATSPATSNRSESVISIDGSGGLD